MKPFLPRNTFRLNLSSTSDVALGKTDRLSAAVKVDQRLLPSFLQFLEFDNNVAKNTIKAYGSDTVQFLAFMTQFGKTKIKPTRMLKYLSHLKVERRCSDTTIKRKLASIRRFFRFLEDFGLSKEFRFSKAGIRFRARTRLPQVMPLAEVSRLLYASRSKGSSHGYAKYKKIRDQVIISLLFYTGMRVGEVVGLDRTNTDASSGMVLVHGKGGKDRVLYVRNLPLLRALRKYVTLLAKQKTGSEALFVNRAGGRLTSRSVEKIFETCLRKAQILGKYTPHSMRHTMATTLLERGTNLRALQEILGHSSILSTQIYTHVAPQQVEEALTKLGTIKLR